MCAQAWGQMFPGLNKDCENCLIQDWVTIATRALRPRNHNQRVRVP